MGRKALDEMFEIYGFDYKEYYSSKFQKYDSEWHLYNNEY